MIYHPIKILLVEDNPGDVLLLQHILAELTSIELKWVHVERLKTAIELLRSAKFDVILLDLVLPDSHGLNTLVQIQVQDPLTPIVVLTGMTDETLAVQAMQAGAQDYLVKGQSHDCKLLLRSIRYAIERKRIAATLEQREREFRTLTENAPDIIARFDRQLRHLYVNSAVIQATGLTVRDFLGKSNREMGMPTDRVEQWEAVLRRVFSTGATISTEFEFLSPTGSRYFQARCVPELAVDGSIGSVLAIVRDLSDSWLAAQKICQQAAPSDISNEAGHPCAILTIDRDITQQQLESQIPRAQQLKSLSTLAGGIAHDLNNVLTPILAVAQLLPLALPDDLNARQQRLLRILDDSSRRGADMVRQILTFARGLDGDLGPVAIGQFLVELQATIESTLPTSIAIDLDLATPELWLVAANTDHLERAFANFCLNARDAMPNGGTLHIAAENRVIDQTYARIHLAAKAGTYVTISFQDTGIGIAPEHLDRIFEPFFTTKAFGAGTGLGLSTAMGIIKHHRGFITVSSEVGQGTQFQVFLPAIDMTATPVADSPELPHGRGELILIVDDEANIRETLQMTLESYDYRVITANNGAEAIADYATHQDEIKAVVLDMMMPTMDGQMTICALQKFNCDRQMRIIACSGVVASSSLRNMPEVKAFLSKPFTAEDLLHTLHRVLADN
jgi:two-component system, cell cycle sensor histidine kinase and response regulator CckA